MAHKKSYVGLTIALDIILINLSFLLSYVVRYQLQIPYPVEEQYYAPFYPYIPFAALLTLLCLITYRIEGLYEVRRPPLAGRGVPIDQRHNGQRCADHGDHVRPPAAGLFTWNAGAGKLLDRSLAQP